MNTIKVCRSCGVPLIWTFCWAYNEYFCINCGGHWGMLGAGRDVPATKELKKLSKKINKLWKIMYQQLIPRSLYSKNKCQKCDKEHHNLHLSKREILKDKVATKILVALKGVFSL